MIETLCFVWGGCCARQCNNNEEAERVTEKKVAYVGQRLNCSEEISVKSQSFSSQNSSTFSLIRMIGILSLIYGIRGQSTDPFPAQLELSSLNGTNGFAINGMFTNHFNGVSVSYAGDINGDKISDVIIGSSATDDNLGRAYVIFGKRNRGIYPTFNISNLDGTNGFVIIGQGAGKSFGRSVSHAGDLNRDGFDDYLIGAYRRSPDKKYQAGSTYLLFGSENHPNNSIIELQNLQMIKKLEINGDQSGDWSGLPVSNGGDVNGDGFDDILIGAFKSQPRGSLQAGKTYVVYGKSHLDSIVTFNLSNIDGTNGYAFHGENTWDQSGFSVSHAGDVNGDSIDDFLIGAPISFPGFYQGGKAYLVFGRRTFGTSGSKKLSGFNGQNGIEIIGNENKGQIGFSVSTAGDVNDDGFDDILVGSRFGNPNRRKEAGKTVVVFGKENFRDSRTISISSINGTNGFIIYGVHANDECSYSIAGGGDVNGDGVGDLLIGAPYADPGNINNAGITYIIFGHKEIGREGYLDLANLNGTNGFKIIGFNHEGLSGFSVSFAGDFNGDGISDIIIGAPHVNVMNMTGKAYILFGRNLNPLQAVTTSSSTKSVSQTAHSTIDDHTSIATQTTSLNQGVQAIVTMDSTPQYVAIAISITLLAGSVLAGGVYYLKRRPESDHPVDAQGGDSVPHVPNSEYMILSHALPPNRGYEDWPSKPPPHTDEHYKKHRLSQLNRKQDEYLEAKFQDAHANYDDIPEL